MALHKIQQLILQIAEGKDISKMSLSDIGQEAKKLNPSIGKVYPQLIKFHMDQLQKKGLLHINRSEGVISKSIPGWARGLLESTKGRLYNIPIYGLASCGPGGVLAEQNLEGFLKVSSTLLGIKPDASFFAVQAEGNSMNRASVRGKSIESGDYLIIDRDGAARDQDVVLAIIDDRAVIKKLVSDPENDQILLTSKSTEKYAPIFIHTDDNFLINGKVVQVIKKPRK